MACVVVFVVDVVFHYFLPDLSFPAMMVPIP